MQCFRFVSFCFLFTGFTISTSNDFFLATDYDREKYVCVTNSTFALSWIMEDITETFHYVSLYLPNSINNFDCDIEDDYRSKTYFIKEPWSLQTKHDLTFDERWEELQTLRTINIDNYIPTPLNFYTVVNISTLNFEIPLSIRIEKEAHIFLCDGEKPNESNCYWFMLQAFNGKQSAIRKCKKETIPYESSKWPQDESCKQVRQSKKHPDDWPEYLFKSEWSHFLLSKNQNVLAFSKVANDQKPETILQLEDSLNPIDVTNMIVHSKIVSGLWKIHNLNFIYTQKEVNETQLGPLFYTAEKTVCISMYLTMCPTCKITLSLANNREVVHQQTYTSEHSGWSNIKFVSDNVPYSSSELKLLVSTRGTSQNMFWAIDKIRLCQKEEFRYIHRDSQRFTEEARCQLMSSPNNVISYSSTTVQSIQNNCPEDTIGEFCVKCTTIFDHCKYITICTENKCVCSAGYYGEGCDYECVRNTYGHGCQKQCGRCFYSCNHVDGTCEDNRCTDSYSGPKCDIPPSVIFANPPEILSVGATEAVIRVSDFRIKNNLNPQAKPELYIVQYKKADHLGDWSYAGPSYPFHYTRSFKIEALESETQYLVRAVVMVNQKPQGGSHLKTSNFTTTCKEISDDNILIKPTNTSALVSLILDSKGTCKSYTISIFDEKASILNKNRTYFNNLTPFTEYTVIVKGNYETHRKKFKTTEGVPRKIRNLIVYAKNETSISMRWDPPYPPTGILREYKIEYYYKKWYNTYRNKKITPSEIPCKLWPDSQCATLTNLETNTPYTLEISARNEYPLSYGAPESTITFTAIESSEAPYDLKIYWTDENRMKLEWKHPNKTNGDVKYFDICIKEKKGRSCKITKQRDVSVDTYNLTYYYEINASEFSPTTEYQVRVFAYNDRNGQPVLESTTSPPDLPELEPDVPLQSSNETITVTLAPRELEGKTDSFRLILLISDEQSDFEYFRELRKYDLKNMKLVLDCDIKSRLEPFNVIVGEKRNYSNCKNTENPPLKPATSYNITIILINKYKNESRDAVYSYIYNTTGILQGRDWNHFELFALLLIIPVVMCFYIKRNAIRHFLRKRHSAESNLELSKTISREEIKQERNGQTGRPNKNREQVQRRDPKEINKNANIFSKKIQTKNFQDYVKTSLQNNKLKRQHEAILKTNVTYETVVEDLHLEHVNMDYISGLQVKNAYAIIKKPKPNEFDEFWKIVWDNNIKHIVLFEHIIVKNDEKYWPNAGKTFHYGNISVACISCQVYTTHQQRKFTLKHKDKSREIEQLHFSLLTAERLYLSSLNYVPFFQKMSKIPLSSKFPVLVHSSPGMRGAGFALLCDISLRMAVTDGSLDVPATLHKLTRCTPEMMLDFDHYVSVHTVIVDTLSHIDTSVNCDSFDLNKLKTKEVQKQLDYVKETLWLDMVNTEEDPERNIYYMAERRAPRANGPLLLTPILCKDESSCYEQEFKVITVDGFRSPDKFLVEQRPTPETLGDFLVLVHLKKVSVVLALSDSATLWPSNQYPINNLSEDVSLRHKTTKNFDGWEWITVDLTVKKDCHTVNIFSVKNWPARADVLPKVSNFVNFCIESNAMVENAGSVIVTCSDGITASSLYVTMYWIVKKIKTENVCDVCTCVRTVRRHYVRFLRDDKQYRFLLDAAQVYMQEFKLYEVT